MRRILLLSLLLVSSALAASEDGVVRGRVVNGTGGPLRGPVEFRLASFGEKGGVWEADDAVSGFRFDGLPTGEENPYLVHASYLGIVYNSRFHLRSGADTTIVFEVYDTTSALSGIRVDEMEIDLSLVESRIRIDEVFRVVNEAAPPRTVVGARGTFRVFLPAPMSDISDLVLAASRGIMPVRRDPIPTERPDEAAIDYPMRPGMTAVAASFDLAYPGELAFDARAPYAIPRVLIAAPPDMRIEGEGISPAHTGARGTGVFTMESIAAGDRIVFRAVGGSPAAPAADAMPKGRIFTGAPPFAEIRLPLIALLAFVLLAALGISLRAPSGRVR
ncbi:MAG: hypothetical protein FJY73_04380 [Candidatus Eisenbacteria bacterium]|nr:hypothetical protein [Candidatus Eisenbacteria bacterium]